jgi:molecular chaperone GrpE
MTTETTPDHDTAAPPAGDAHDELEALRAELEQLRAQSLLERADLENQRRRMQRDVQNACRFANKQLLGDLLPVIDSLDAALANAADEDPLRDGLVLTRRELIRVAGNHGLAEVAPAAGDAFDPDRHQAMSMVEDPAVAPGTVSALFQKGWLLNEQLLRPALVAVAQQD